MTTRGLRGLLRRLTRDSDEIEADELRDTTTAMGATLIGDLVPRTRSVVAGEVRSVSLRPAAQVAALVVDIFDGSGSMQLVWLGRRAIAGIEPGVLLRVHGRVTSRRGLPVIFNPSYEIIPTRG